MLCQKILKRGLSVRETENLAKTVSRQKQKTQKAKDRHILEIEDQLRRALGSKVTIKHNKSRGNIQIDFYSLNDFDRIVKLLSSVK
jgi:ParB family chromosome partitioning protein